VIFVPNYVSRVVFKGGILGGAHQFWDNPYLNSTTVLFDMLLINGCPAGDIINTMCGYLLANFIFCSEMM